MTLGANTFFVHAQQPTRICYIGQVNYWLTDEQRTRLTASVYCRPERDLRRPGLGRYFDTHGGAASPARLEPTLHSDRPEQHGLGRRHPGRHRPWYGLYTIGIFHLTSTLDIIGRAEWFDDVKGTRTGIETNYPRSPGLNWHPLKWLEFRPEIRGDFAGAPAFGRNGAHTYRSQLTAGSASWSSSEPD